MYNVHNKYIMYNVHNKYIVYNVHNYSVLYNNTVCPVTFEGWHFSHIWKHFHYGVISLTEEVWAIELVPPANFYWNACIKPGKWAVMYLCVRSVDLASFCDFSIGFLNCSDSVVFSVFLLDFWTVPTVWYSLFFC